MKLSEFLNRFNGKVEMIIEYNGQEAMKAVESDGYALRYVKDQTEAVCMKAVERNGYALQYVKDQTEAVCMKAVERNGDALRYVKDQTEAVCMKAVERNGYALRYVNKSIFENDMVEEKPETIIIDGLTYNKI